MESFPIGLLKDIEKGSICESTTSNERTALPEVKPVPKWKKPYHAFERFLLSYNLETRGIQRVEPHERHSLQQLGFTQSGIIWWSMNLAANNITLGMLGPAVYGLGFVDSCLCAIFGMLLGNLPVGHQAMLGPRSGHRTLIVARYTMGYYPVKVVVLLNIVVLLGYCLIDCVIAGQMISYVSPHNSLSVAVGIVIVAVITWIVSTFGYQIFHYYERYSWVPQLVVLSILAGVAGPDFDVHSQSQGNLRTIIGNRISFFSICLSSAITYAGCAGSFFVYYPETTSGWKIFTTTQVGLSLSFASCYILGIGLASALPSNIAWSDAYNSSQGALIVEGFKPLGAFGSFCSVVVALGLIANLIPTAYASGIDFQILGRYCMKIPRVVWNTIGVVIFTVCALAGRDHLSEIFTNFLALMGYWTSIWVVISIEEEFIFRRRMKGQDTDRGFDWTVWDQRDKLPYGFAAMTAFVIGWVGAILCMAQLWYIGPIAKLVGDYGADMGNYVGFAWAAVVFPPLRWLELKKLRR